MLRRKNDQKKKVKQAFIDGDVSTKLLTKIIKLASSFFFLEICDICKNDELTKIITNSKQTYASLITKNENTDIVIVANNDFFNISVNLLFKSLCETIVIYFPFENITFQQFLYNCEPYSNNPQKSAIIRKIRVSFTEIENAIMIEPSTIKGERRNRRRRIFTPC